MATQEDEAAREHRNLIDFARTTEWNLYALLDLPDPHTSSPQPLEPQDERSAPATGPTEAALKKAWRDSARKNHPDKNRGDEKAAATRLDRSQRAYAVLRDPAARTAYDDRRRAEAASRAERERMSGARRAMVERLERAERQAAAPSPGAGAGAGARRDESDAERRARELRAFEADMARKKAEYLAKRQQRREDEAAAAAAVAARRQRSGRAAESAQTGVPGAAEVVPGPAGSPLASAPEWQDGVQSYYAYTMARLREAQRRQDAGTLGTDGPVPRTGLPAADMRMPSSDEIPRFKSFKARSGQAGASAGATQRRHEAERERLRREIVERERGSTAVK